MRLVVSGKISVNGNAKTRTYKIHCGFNSLTTKMYKLDKSMSIIRTLTGVMGIYIYVYF